jgi:hypothetical protein
MGSYSGEQDGTLRWRGVRFDFDNLHYPSAIEGGYHRGCCDPTMGQATARRGVTSEDLAVDDGLVGDEANMGVEMVVARGWVSAAGSGDAVAWLGWSA